jgi:hypothetical protein
VPVVRRLTTRVWVGLAGLSYLGLGVLLWGEAWTRGAATHTLCGCGDPALFLWFFQWPATALAHGYNPFYSTALFHPHGINLLAQTSVLGISLPLVPVTWIWGPVAALNVASTITPALTAFIAFAVFRRWVHWMPAAYLGGLLFGFSPFVLNNLQYAHLMSSALMLLPLMLAVLDDMVVRQRHSVRRNGVALGVLLFLQFFLSSELLTIVVLVVVVSTLALAAVTLAFRPEVLRQRLPHVVKAVGVAAAVGGVLLALPVSFALDGPAHLSGLIWPNIGVVGGYIGSSFVQPYYTQAVNYSILGGYLGTPLPSGAFLGWAMLATLGAGWIVWWRDRRLFFFGFVLAFCMVCSLGERRGEWVPANVFGHLPVLEDVIEQRFMAVGFLAAAVMLALVIDRIRADAPVRFDLHGSLGRRMGVGAALGVAAVALVPMAAAFDSTLPFAMRPVLLPRWYTTVAPTLAPDRVLLSYPVPFSGIQVALSWQAVDAMHFSQAGGSGPQGVAARAGSARAGFSALAQLSFGFKSPYDVGPSSFAAVRHALAVWRVTTVVIAPDARAPALQQGHDPMYAAAFMTAALGQLPTIQDGAWVWNDLSLSRHKAWSVARWVLPHCVARAERPVSGRAFVLGSPANLQAPVCVALEALL